MENKEHFVERWKAEDGEELKRYRASEFINIIERGEKIEEFDIDLYYKMIEKRKVYQDRIIIYMLDRTEVECIIG